jgi:hypothetical protein
MMVGRLPCARCAFFSAISAQVSLRAVKMHPLLEPHSGVGWNTVLEDTREQRARC